MTSVDLPTPEEPEERHRPAGDEPGRKGVEALSRLRRDHADGDARGDGLDGGATARDVVADVGLVQQDDRLRPALPGEDERALDAAEAEVSVEARHEEDRVHVRRQDLGHGPLPRRPADEGGSPGQDGLDDRAVAALARAQGHPVADRRPVLRPAGLVPQGAGHRRERLPLLRAHAQQARVAHHDAAGDEALGGERGEGLRDGADEAEFAKPRPRQAISRDAAGTRP